MSELIFLNSDNDYKFRCLSCGEFKVGNEASALAYKRGVSQGNCVDCIMKGQTRSAINVAFPMCGPGCSCCK